MNLEQLCAIENYAWDFTSTLPNFATCIDDSFSEKNLSDVEGIANWRAPNSLRDPNVSPKLKTTEGQGVGARSLARST